MGLGQFAYANNSNRFLAAGDPPRHHYVFLGGDHSVTLPLLRAARAQHGELALVHFDAHGADRPALQR